MRAVMAEELTFNEAQELEGRILKMIDLAKAYDVKYALVWSLAEEEQSFEQVWSSS